jgi:hypothetical protein
MFYQRFAKISEKVQYFKIKVQNSRAVKNITTFMKITIFPVSNLQVFTTKANLSLIIHESRNGFVTQNVYENSFGLRFVEQSTKNMNMSKKDTRYDLNFYLSNLS